jgi:hypothetical protein
MSQVCLIAIASPTKHSVPTEYYVDIPMTARILIELNQLEPEA